MLAATLPLGWQLTIIFIAGVAAGISNGIAGGGTFLSFPTLLALGVPTLQANVSSSVGIVPSTFGGIHGFREELTSHKRLLRELAAPCVAGSIVGCAPLLEGSNQTFNSVVPWLIGSATFLFALAPRIAKKLSKKNLTDNVTPVRRRSLFIGIFIASMYGGYFGAGLGIVLLAVLALTLPFDIYNLQGIRSVLGMLINTVAAIVFIIRGHLDLYAVYALLVGSFIGGLLGTRLIRRVSPKVVRTLVILVGAGTTIRLAIG